LRQLLARPHGEQTEKVLTFYFIILTLSILMDKFKAHYSLSKIKQLLRTGNYSITASARKSAFKDFSLLEKGYFGQKSLY
jgi:hypothetical protein